MGQRYRSTVKWFSNLKGYGFLNPISDGGRDIIIHQREVRRDRPDEYVQFHEGDRVEFTLTETDKGLRALEVQRV
ncbi:MAG: cold shock domain-containing protein [Anaerolineales bacterium]|nr:cold shock domain-containing protein [Anaerolineales bacterium]MCA9885519.1 cold shock domain-containing protein [Anaerolineae bacterium]